ncbi:Eukaryotic translation initiation factor eIF2A family protein [Perilla frutescens var. frutescens]|nr:Eukaryotic translation initiation factor eIF2A family protein [Perilla frutescens var. frutescens]
MRHKIAKEKSQGMINCSVKGCSLTFSTVNAAGSKGLLIVVQSDVDKTNESY